MRNGGDACGPRTSIDGEVEDSVVGEGAAVVGVGGALVVGVGGALVDGGCELTALSSTAPMSQC